MSAPTTSAPRSPEAAEAEALMAVEALAAERRARQQQESYERALMEEVDRRVLALATTTQVVQVTAYDPAAALPVTVAWQGASLSCGHARGYTPAAGDRAVMHLTNGFPVLVDAYVGTAPTPTTEVT